MKGAVSGPAPAHAIEAALHARAPGEFDILPAADAAHARRAVLDRQASAAYAIAADGRSAALYTAKADGVSLSEPATATFTPLAQAQKATISTVELAPTAHGDVTGTGMFSMGLVWNIVPYICVMMLMRATSLGRRGKLVTIAAVGAFVSVVGYLVAHATGAIPNEPLTMLYGFLTMVPPAAAPSSKPRSAPAPPTATPSARPTGC